MQPYFIITREEMDALAGQPHATRALYFEIRQRMDMNTGLVGARKGAGVSWRAFMEAMYIEQEQGNEYSGMPAKTTVRRWADRLMRCGLIRNESVGKRLVIRCLLARITEDQNRSIPPNTPHSASKKPGTNPAQTRHTYPGTDNDIQPGIVDKSSNALCLQGVAPVNKSEPGTQHGTTAGTNPAQTRHSEPGTHQKSELRGRSREDISNLPRPRVDRASLPDTSAFFAMLGDLDREHSRLDFRLENSRGDPRVRAMAERWVQSGLPLEEFWQLVAERLARYPDLDRVPPSYFANPVAEYIAGRTAPPAASGHGASQVRQGGGGCRVRDTSTTPEQDRELRRREDERTLRRAEALGVEQADGESMFELRLRVDREEAKARAREKRGNGARDGVKSVREIISQGLLQ